MRSAMLLLREASPGASAPPGRAPDTAEEALR